MDIDSLEPFLDLQPAPAKKSMTRGKGKSGSGKKTQDTANQHYGPEKKPQKKKSKSKPDDIFASLGLQTVDDLLGATVDNDRHSDDSELHTEYSEHTKPAKFNSDIFHSKPKSDTKDTDVFRSKPRTETYASMFHSSNKDTDNKLDVFTSKNRHDSVISELESEIRTRNTTTPRVVSYTESIDEKIGLSSHATSRKSLRKKDKNLKEETDDEYSEDFTDEQESVHSDWSTECGSDRSYTDSYTNQSESYTYSDRYTLYLFVSMIMLLEYCKKTVICGQMDPSPSQNIYNVVFRCEIGQPWLTYERII